jgi:cytochrome P450
MAIAPLTLSDGTYIPKGTKLELATSSIHADDSFFPKAGEYDGLRSYRARQVPGAEHKHQFISVGAKDLAWGYGRHSCPGRFVADIEMKIALAEILLNYDVKLADGQERPKNIEFEAVVSFHLL